MAHCNVEAGSVGVEISGIPTSVKFEVGSVVDNLDVYAGFFLTPAGFAEIVCLRIVERAGREHGNVVSANLCDIFF